MKRTLHIAGVFTIAASTFACKPPADTVAKISVMTPANSPVVGAVVHMYDANNGTIIDEEAATNGSGVAVFNFNEYYKRGGAGLAVLDVEVSRDGNTEYMGIVEIMIEDVTEESFVFDP